MRRTAALIAGGGPAGAAAAIALARGGVEALLLERATGPHDVVCGGFLGRDALAALAQAGLDAAALGARPIKKVRLIAGLREAESTLPFPAAGLSRRLLDTALLARAQEEGAILERGVTVRAAAGPPFRLRLAEGEEVAADALFLATGKHDLRGLARPREAGRADPSVGLRARFMPSPATSAALEGVIELHLYAHGYAGLLLQEDGSANLCLSVARSRLATAGGGAEGLLAALAPDAPRLLERIGEGAPPPEWQAVGAVPYGWRARETVPGLFRLGDQAAVIASLAGDGIAIALASGAAAGRHYLRDGPAGASAYQRRFARAARRPIAIASALRHLAEGRHAGRFLPLLARFPPLAGWLARLTRIG